MKWFKKKKIIQYNFSRLLGEGQVSQSAQLTSPKMCTSTIPVNASNIEKNCSTVTLPLLASDKSGRSKITYKLPTTQSQMIAMTTAVAFLCWSYSPVNGLIYYGLSHCSVSRSLLPSVLYPLSMFPATRRLYLEVPRGRFWAVFIVFELGIEFLPRITMQARCWLSKLSVRLYVHHTRAFCKMKEPRPTVEWNFSASSFRMSKIVSGGRSFPS